jgi:hypothetical protein
MYSTLLLQAASAGISRGDRRWRSMNLAAAEGVTRALADALGLPKTLWAAGVGLR